MKRRIGLLFFNLLFLIPLIALTVFANSPPSNTVEPERITGAGLVLYLILALGGMVLTVIVESLATRILWVYGDFSGLVIKTNILSQVVMHGVNLLLNPILYRHALLLLIILELLVYLMEFLIYKRKMQLVPVKMILTYTCVANTLSLLAGVVGYYLAFYF